MEITENMVLTAVAGRSANGACPFASSHIKIPRLYTSDLKLYPARFWKNFFKFWVNVKFQDLLFI